MGRVGHKVGCICCYCLKDGVNNPNYGHKWSEEKKEEYRKKRIGSDNPFFGKKQTEKHRISMKSGKECCWYIDGRTSLIGKIRCLIEYTNWRNNVFQKDNYTCQDCKKRGNYLEAHHIREFNKILSEFLIIYNQFSPIEDKETLVRLAITYEPFWDITNGKTLCRKCHDLTKRKNRILNGKI